MKLKLSLPHGRFHLQHHSSHIDVKEKIYRKSDPAHMWHLLLVIALGLALVSVAFHFALYLKINRGEAVEVTTDLGTEKINEAKLTFILSLFEKKVQSFEAGKLIVPTVTDPSL